MSVEVALHLAKGLVLHWMSGGVQVRPSLTPQTLKAVPVSFESPPGLHSAYVCLQKLPKKEKGVVPGWKGKLVGENLSRACKVCSMVHNGSNPHRCPSSLWETAGFPDIPSLDTPVPRYI